MIIVLKPHYLLEPLFDADKATGNKPFASFAGSLVISASASRTRQSTSSPIGELGFVNKYGKIVKVGSSSPTNELAITAYSNRKWSAAQLIGEVLFEDEVCPCAEDYVRFLKMTGIFSTTALGPERIPDTLFVKPNPGHYKVTASFEWYGDNKRYAYYFAIFAANIGIPDSQRRYMFSTNNEYKIMQITTIVYVNVLTS